MSASIRIARKLGGNARLLNLALKSPMTSFSAVAGEAMAVGNANISCRTLSSVSLDRLRHHHHHQFDSITGDCKRWRHQVSNDSGQKDGEERRKKKKDRKAKKGKKGPADVEATDESEIQELHQVEDIDDPFSDVDEEDEDDGEEQEPTLPDVGAVKQKMMTAVQKFQDSLKSIRGVEPTPEIFDDVQVNAYGEMTPLIGVGQVIISSPTLAHINCFDPSVSKEVAKALQLAMGLNPQVEEGGIVKVPLPRVSKEIREANAKQLNKMAESCRRRLRKHRRKAMDTIKLGKDGKIPGISKDDAFARAKEIEAVADDVNSTVKNLTDDKLAAIMKV